MASRVSKQTYFGRIISPAVYHEGKEDPFITFNLFLDNHGVNRQTKERVTAKVSCSYALLNDKDPVGFILCRIFDKESPDEGGLAGMHYKSVEVLVEGTERLTEVTDKEGVVIPFAYYKNLDWCTVQVVDKEILKLYKAHISGEESVDSNQEAEETGQNRVEQPNRAPSNKKPVPQKTARKQYEVGDTLVGADGVTYEFLGGNASLLTNWKAVLVEVQEEVEEADEEVPPMLVKPTPEVRQVTNGAKPSSVTRQSKPLPDVQINPQSGVRPTSRQVTPQAAIQPARKPSIQELLQDGDDGDENPLFTQVSKNLAV